MSIDAIFGKCDEPEEGFLESVVGSFIDPAEAAQRYFNRVNMNNPLEGYLVSFSKLKEFVQAIEGSEHKDDISYVRIWKATSTEHGKCPQSERRFFLEDLVITPTLSSGEDAHANAALNSNMANLPILSSLRPCPKWCGSRESGRFTFFYERFENERTTDNPNEGLDPYRNYIQCDE